MLSTTDVDTAPSQLVYTLTSLASHGVLRLDGIELGLNDTFTQADIDAGRLSYSHDGSENFSDSFGFSVDDGAGTPSTGSFAITVTPLNDNAPLISSAASFSVAENSTAVGTVTATDADLPAVPLQYSLSGTDAALFTIDASGNLAFLDAPDFETPGDLDTNNVYQLTVQVSDGLLNSSQALSVTVTDVAEGSPNNAPAGTDTTITTPEDTPYVFTAADFGFSDPADSPPHNLLAVHIATLPTDRDTGSEQCGGDRRPADQRGRLECGIAYFQPGSGRKRYWLCQLHLPRTRRRRYCRRGFRSRSNVKFPEH